MENQITQLLWFKSPFLILKRAFCLLFLVYRYIIKEIKRNSSGNMNDNESQEMYLETILKIQKRKGSVRSVEIAEELGYSRPSVSRAVGIMKDDGFIVVNKDGLIELTESGRKKAENVFLRHNILTDALVKMGLERLAAEENACRVEHVITEEAFEAIENYFKNK